MQRRDSYMPGGGTTVFLAAMILLVPWLGETLFYSKGEPREAIVAVTMLQSGNWTLPLSFGCDLPYKPPFLAWLIAVFAKLFNGGNISEFIARLPSALAAVAMTMAAYRWASRIHGQRFGMILSLVTVTSFEVFRAALACRVDMVLTALMVIPLFMMYDMHEDTSRRLRLRPLRWLGVWLMFSGATLTKGPVGALLPCFAFGIYCLLRRDNFWRTLVSMLGLSVASFVLPALWYYAAYLQGGEAFLDLMYEEVFGRLLGTMSYESHVNPAWYNFVTLAAGLLPWTLLLLFALAGLRRWRRAPLNAPGMFCATVAATIVLFYCIPASKRSVYLLPAYPFIAYGISCVLSDPLLRRPVRAFTWVMAVVAVLAPLALAGAYFIDIPGLRLGAMPWPGYVTLPLAFAAGLVWMINRHSPVGHVIAIVWALLLAYCSAGMPAVLNPRSDSRVLGRVAASPYDTVYEYNGPTAYRFYSLNYYLSDGIRPLTTLEALEELPVGSYVLVPAVADTAGMNRSFVFEPLLDRSADHRDPVWLAIRK